MPSPALQTASLSTGVVRLEITDGAMMKYVELTGGPMVAGRLAAAAIPLPHPSVSREHAEFYRDPAGHWHVKDLNSRNGTFVGENRITDCVLQAGESCRIGPFTLILRTAASGEDALGPHDTTSSISFTLSESDISNVRGLEQFPAPKIEAAHHTLLSEFGRRLAETATPPERLAALCELMVHPRFHGRTALALRVRGESSALHPLCPPRVSSEHWLNEPPHVSRTLLRAVCETGAPLMASSIAGGVAIDMSVSMNTLDMAAIACPLRQEGGASDILYVSFPTQYGTGEWLALVALAARQYQQAEGDHQMRRQRAEQEEVERDLRKAKEVQEGFVPDPASIAKLPGFDVAVSFEPCRWVGGDYVDALPTRDGRVLLVLADVSGKGMPAALITSMLHTMVHTSVRAGIPVAEMMTTMNEHLCEHLEPDMFVTAVAIVVDPATGELECVNAGHPAPQVISPSGAVRGLQMGENFPLGIVPADLLLQRGRIEPNGLLAIYSDGLSEMKTPGGALIGTGQVNEDFAAEYAADPQAAMAELVTRLCKRFNAVEPPELAQDDRTFLIARRR